MEVYDIDAYGVYESDGGGIHDTLIALFSNKIEAEKYKDRSKMWRSVRPYKKLTIVFDTVEEADENSKENLRKSALAKLTAAEKAALGIKE